MASGDAKTGVGTRTGPRYEAHLSPIVEAIAVAESGTSGEIRVHLSRRWIENDPFGHARALFEDFGMTRTARRNAVLIYLNLRRRKFAIVADEGFVRAVGPRYWDGLAQHLREDLLSTHHENAVSLAVRRVGEMLRKHFPAESGS